MSVEQYKDYFADDSAANWYRIKLFFYTLVIFAGFFAYVNNWIHVAVMAVVVSICVTRWLIAFHELFHLRNADRLDVFTRLQPIPFSPLSLGYREYLEIHKGHHAHTATEKDPDAFHIRGGLIKAFIGSVTQQEQAAIRYLRAYGLNRELCVYGMIRLAIFAGLFSLAPEHFIYWWLVLRGTYIINDFVFFHVVHYRHGETGTFPLRLPSWLMYPFILIYGIDVVYATMHHDIHHAYPRVAAKSLRHVARLQLTQG